MPGQPTGSTGGKASWRGGAKGTAATPSHAAPKGGWTRRADSGPERSRMRHRLAVAGWTLLLVLLVAGFIVKLLYQPIRTPMVLVAAIAYDPPFPPNAWAREDLERFYQLDKDEILRCSEVAWESKDQALRQIARQLSAAKPGGPNRDTVILYLSMHGAVDGAGRPCLVPPGASPTKSDQWLPVREFLEAVFRQDGEGRLPDQVVKLLILDSNRMDANWQMGLLENSFADRLETVIEDARIPNLVVLNSTSPGQFGWTSPELQASVFGHFCRRGLQGAADAAPIGNDDSIVSSQELYRYLQVSVRQWATEDRADVQEPMLLPRNVDVPIAYVRLKSDSETPPGQPASDPRWSEIHSLWDKHQELKSAGRGRLRPAIWEEYQQNLLRLEQLVQSGAAYEDDYHRTKRNVEELAATLLQDPLPPNVAAYNLPLASRLRDAAGLEEQRKKLHPPWIMQEPAAKAAKTEKESASERYDYLPAAAEGWKWVLENPTAEKLPELFRFVDQADNRPRADVAELQFLRMLERHLDWKTAAGGVKPALAALHLSQMAAAPSDVRAIYLTSPVLDQADRLRRQAEDSLFVGTPAAMATATRCWQEAAGADGKDGKYSEAIALSQKAASAFELRDRAFAETPYLAQWLLARPDDAAVSQQEDLKQLLQTNQELASQLDQSLVAGQWTPELDKTQQLATEKLDELEKAYADECYRLRVTAGDDTATLRRIITVLSVPLATGETRNQLRDKYLRIISRGGAEQAAAVAETPAMAGEDGPAASRLTHQLANWDEHPALVLVRGTAPQDASRAKSEKKRTPEQMRMLLAEQGETLRGMLRSLPVTSAQEIAKTTQKLREDAKNRESPAAIRDGCSRADQLVRQSAVLLARPFWADSSGDPTEQLRRLDLHFLLLWHCRRTLEDFWGPGPGSNASFFEIAAGDYLQSARELCPANKLLAFDAKPLPELLSARQEAASSGISPAAPELTVDPEDRVSPHSVTVNETGNLPRGEAALFVQNPAGELLPVLSADNQDVRRMTLAVEDGNKVQTQRYLVPSDDRIAGLNSLLAVALYRGHVFSTSFPVERATAGIEITHLRPQSVRPKVTVRGEAGRRASVVFVFDCSGSMSASLTQRSDLPGAGARTPRIDAARDTLLAILPRLIDADQPYQVGLVFYAHRARWSGWAGEKPGSVVTRPPGLEIHPSEDVEVVLPLRRFTRNELDLVHQKLESLQPWGQTPLYLSILQAVDVLRAAGQEGERRIVVITDGLDEPGFMGTLPGVVRPKVGKKFRKDVEDVLAQPGNEGIRVDILGFSIQAGSAQEQQSLQDLKELARRTRGAFYPVDDPSTLLKALEKSLELERYVVQRVADGRVMTPDPVELNRTWVFNPVTGKTEYRVRLVNPERPADAVLEVEGGEAFELYVKDASRSAARSLVHRRYDRDLRASRAAIPDPQAPQRRVFIGAHLPEWIGSAVRFPISIQNASEEQFSPRPAEVWAQIRPVMPDDAESSRVYTFYDLAFEPDRPVPVLNFVAPDWPVEAKSAAIQIWCKFNATQPDRAIPLAAFRQGPVHLDAVPDVSFELETKAGSKPGEPYRVLIREKHAEGQPLDTVKVEMVPAPSKCVHRYNPQAGTVHHVFYYSDVDAARLADARILLTSQKRLFDRAVAMQEPLVVTIPRRTLPVGR